MDPTTLDEETEEEVVKEMIGGSIPRVDAVSGPASGLRFVVLKAGEDQDPEAIAAVQQPEETKETPVTKSDAPEGGEITDPELVLKADGDVDLSEVLDPTEVPADPETVHANGEADVPGDPTDPGSAAWEAMDAATARKWTSILSRAKNALGVMGDRELQEVASGNGDGDDVDAAFDLQDACDAVDYAISILAPFAVDEQSEADCEAADLESVSKALAPFDPNSLDLIEQLAPVRKAGRVLSSSNEQAIRDAVTSLTGVLNSLPQPTAEPVAKSKEADVATASPVVVKVTADTSEFTEKMADAADEMAKVTKAKGDDPAPMIACYNADGDLIGVVAEGDLTSVGAGTPADPSDEPADPAAAPPAPDEPVDPAAVAPVDVPAEPVAKSDEPQDEPGEDLTAVRKSLEELQERHETVLKRLEVLEAQPAGGGPRLGGAANGSMTPIEGGLVGLRGQSGGNVESDYARVQKALEEETDPQRRAVLGNELTLMALRAVSTP